MVNRLLRVSALLLVMSVCVAFMPMMHGDVAYGKSLKLSKKTVYIAKGKKVKLKVKGTKKKAKWSSSDSRIATVSKKGKVKGKKPGIAVITATVKGKSLRCTVHVMDKYSAKARALRTKILKQKGRKIEKKFVYDYGDTTTVVSISANKKDNKLVFQRVNKFDTSEGGNKITLTIDLIDNLPGAIEYESYPDGITHSLKGTLTRNFTEKGGGVTAISRTETNEEDGSVINHPITEEDKELLAYFFHAASGDFNLLMKKKAKGYTMKKIGFVNCK